MIRQWLLRCWIPAGLILLWQTASGMAWLDPLFFPSPARVAMTAWQLTMSGVLTRHLAATMARFLAAFLLGSSAGIALGLTMGSLPFWRRSMEGLISGLNATPKLALLPAFLVLFGLNDVPRLLPAALSCFVLMTLYTMDAARAVRPEYLDVARSYGADRRALILRVYVPACLPSLFTGARLSLGNSLVMVVATEMMGVPSGLGSFIWITSQTLALDRMYVGIACCTLIGVVKNSLMTHLERRVTPWVS